MTRTFCSIALISGALLAQVALGQDGAKDHSALIAKAKEAAAYDLKDPSSAQFRNLFVSYTFQNYVCGEINAKNSYGAYTGFTLFSYDSDTNKATILDSTHPLYEIDLEMFKMICKAPSE